MTQPKPITAWAVVAERDNGIRSAHKRKDDAVFETTHYWSKTKIIKVRITPIAKGK